MMTAVFYWDVVTMSRAFVKEQDDADAPEDLPERPVSPHPNAVTPRGLRLIDEEIEKHRKELAHAQHTAERALIARASRDLRYWTHRRSTAQLIQPPQSPEKVAFGVRVTIERNDGRRQTLSIVGEDEADFEKGLIAYTAPIAQALIGASVGDEVTIPGGTAEIVSLEPVEE
jgi:transcription elongation GreA/GreB family factor